MWRRSCKKVIKTSFDVIVSLGMFTAIMAFHLISFVVFLMFSISGVIGISLIYSYFSSATPPVTVQNCLILSILTFMSKYQLIFYYKLIYPGDNYERHCWSFIRKVMKLIYAIFGSYAFLQIIELHWNHNLDLLLESANIQNSSSVDVRNTQRVDTRHGHQELIAKISNMASEFRLKSIIMSLLQDEENRAFLLSMAILAHLFNMCLYTEYSHLVKFVPVFKIKSLVAITYSVTIQTLYLTLCFFEFYIVHSWVPFNWINDHIILYTLIVQISLVLWILQLSLFELITERMCSIFERNDDPFYWFQNMTRGRIFVLNFILLPCLVNLFYTKEDYYKRLNKVLKWNGIIIPWDNYNRSLFFFAFFCSTIVHSLKSLMLLKNGLVRLVYSGWICYFQIQDLRDLDCYDCCCCKSEENSSDEETSSWGTTTVSEITEEEITKCGSCDPDKDKNIRGHGHRRNDKGRRSKVGRHLMAMRDHVGDQQRQGEEGQDQGQEEEDVNKNHAYASVNKAGIGDSQWTPEKHSRGQCPCPCQDQSQSPSQDI